MELTARLRRTPAHTFARASPQIHKALLRRKFSRARNSLSLPLLLRKKRTRSYFPRNKRCGDGTGRRVENWRCRKVERFTSSIPRAEKRSSFPIRAQFPIKSLRAAKNI